MSEIIVKKTPHSAFIKNINRYMAKVDNIEKEYITEAKLTAKNYLTEIPEEYVTKTDLANIGGGKLYMHAITIMAQLSDGIANIYTSYYSTSNTPITNILDIMLVADNLKVLWGVNGFVFNNSTYDSNIILRVTSDETFLDIYYLSNNQQNVTSTVLSNVQITDLVSEV